MYNISLRKIRVNVVSGSEPSAAFVFATAALLSAGAAHAEETDTVDTAVSTLIDAVKVIKRLAALRQMLAITLAV